MDPSPTPARATPGNSLTQLIDRFSTLLLREPDDRSELLKLLHGAHERNLVDAEALTIIEGAITVAEMTRQGQLIASSTFENMTVYTLVALLYLSMSLPLSFGLRRLEARFALRRK